MKFDPDLSAVCVDCGRIDEDSFPPKWLLAHDGIRCPDCYTLLPPPTWRPNALDIETEILRMEREYA